MNNRFGIRNLILFLLLPGFTFAQGIIIPSGAYVIANSGTISLKNDWVNNGSFTANGGVIIFSGTTQSLQGSSHTTFNNLTIASGSTTTVDSPGQSVKSVLLCDGTLNAEGHVTLLSTNSQTALIDGTGSGSVLGNLTMQRHLDSSFGYRLISSPFQYATVSQVAGYINLTDSFPHFFKYVENVNHTGWETDTTRTDTLKPMAGYGANFGTIHTSSTFSLNGIVNNGSISTTMYNHNQTFTLGFNLVGNPYPEPIDWDASSGWTKTNIANAIYYYNTSDTDQYNGTYSSYIAGVSSDGRANNIIPAMQGYFVHVSSGSYPVTGTLGSTNSVRINNLSPLYHKPSKVEIPLLRLRAGIGENKTTDPVVIYFNSQAKVEFDEQMDAIKMMNTDDYVPNIYALAPDAKKLSIYALPWSGDTISVVPLGLNIARSGGVLFDGSDMEYMPAGMQIYLSDIEAGVSQELTANSKYSVQLNAGKYEGRFFLSYIPAGLAPDLISGNIWNAYSSGSMLYINLYLLSGGKGEILISNMGGQVVLQQSLDSYGLHEIKASWPTGVYIVSLVSNGKSYSKKVLIINQ